MRLLTVLLVISFFGLVYWVHLMRVEDEIADRQEWQIVKDDMAAWKESTDNKYGVQ